ncbi:MAG: response regulator [Nitrospirota bacterium]
MKKHLQIHPEKVLLVEDNELLLFSMKRFLEREFNHVMAISTGEDAIAHLKGQFYNVVVLDIRLPGMDGWEVIEHIKRESPNTRVIVITTSEDEGTREKALSRGASEFLEKPFDLEELREILLRIIHYNPILP